jgi:protein-tyrosine phosphatase
LVVAHPERTRPTPDTEWILQREMGCGSVLQLTAGSIAGSFGQRERDEALRLLRRAPRVVIASDAHGASRMPSLTPALAALSAIGVREPNRLVAGVPRALIELGLDIWPAAKVA